MTEKNESTLGASELSGLLCVKCSAKLVIGDYFTHTSSGHRMACTGIVRRIVDGKIVTVIEISDA